MKKSFLPLVIFTKYLIDIIPNYIHFITINKNEISIVPTNKNFKKLILFLLKHNKCKFTQLVDICGVDYPNRSDRFEVIYNLLSLSYNFRIRIKVKVNENIPIDSVSDIYKSALWLEREVWDMFGIFFSNHKDLRRILTDYGFDGYPFRKDFPQIGFVEVRYDDKKKHVLYEPVELAQEYRKFNFLSPWIQVK